MKNINPFSKSKRALCLREEYTKLTGKIPPGIHFESFSNMTEYEDYLEERIKNIRKEKTLEE